MIMVWVRLIQKGIKTITDVPKKYTKEVQKILEGSEI